MVFFAERIYIARFEPIGTALKQTVPVIFYSKLKYVLLVPKSPTIVIHDEEY